MPEWDLRFIEYVGPSEGITCAGCGAYFKTYRGYQRHDDAVHGGARCTPLTGRWTATKGA